MKEERRHPIGQDLVLAVTLADIQTSDAGVTEVADPVDIALDFAVSCGGVTQHYTNDPDDSSNTDVSWNNAGDRATSGSASPPRSRTTASTTTSGRRSPTATPKSSSTKV